MPSRRLGGAARIAAVLLASVPGACKRAPAGTEGALAESSAAPAASAPVRPPPADHLAPGELVEGAVQAFGLKLPRAMHVEESFADVVYASAPSSVESLAAYFGARVESGSLRKGAESATFEGVHVRGSPGVDLLVRIREAPGGSSVVIRDVTPHPGPDLPDESARWRHVGLTPDGRPTDPTHLE